MNQSHSFRSFQVIVCSVVLVTIAASTTSIVATSGGDDRSPAPGRVAVGTEARHREFPVPRPPRTLGVRRSAPPTAVSVGDFVSVQVNVDAQGMNIVGDAANEPSMAIDPTDPNRIAIGWRQFDTITSSFRQAGRAYSRDGGARWTAPGVLQPGQFSSDPVLVADADGVIYYYALQPGRGPGDWSCYLYRSFDGGVTFPQQVYAFGGDKAWITVDKTAGIGRGHIYVAWSPFAGCCPGLTFNRSTDGGVTFSQPAPLPGGPFWGTVDVGPDGEFYVAGAASTIAANFVVLRSLTARNGGVAPVFDLVQPVDLGGFSGGIGGGPNPAGLLGQVNIATDHSNGPTRGNVYVLSSVTPFSFNDPQEVMFIRSTDGGVTWSPPLRLNSDDPGAWQWFGTMSVAPNGRIDVFWNDTRNDPTATFSELYYTFSADGGLNWAPDQPVSPPFNHFLGYPQQQKLGDYYHAISEKRSATIAYAATFNGEQDVYFLRIPHPPEVDVDGDGDIDRVEFDRFSECVAEGGGADPEVCESMDFDNDGDTDLIDFAGFQAAYTGDCGVAILEHPSRIVACEGDRATFDVAVDREGVAFQWMRNGEPLPGQTEAMLVVNSIEPEVLGNYSVQVSGQCRTLVSTTAGLEITGGPAILRQPQLAVVCPGSFVDFEVEAEGVGPLTYQWRRDGGLIAEADEPVLQIESIDSVDEGVYDCIVADRCSNARVSMSADLVIPFVDIVAQPGDLENCTGEAFFLSVTAANPTSYQWFKSDEPLPGETGFRIQIAAATPDDAGIYYVRVNGPCDSVDSQGAQVTVIDCTP